MNGKPLLTKHERVSRKLIALEALDALVLDTLSRTSITSIADLEALSQLHAEYKSAKVYINLVAGFTND